MNQWTGAQDPRERFASKIEKATGGCWLWTGTLHSNGYGLFDMKIGGRWKKFWAHRAAYVFYVGPIPEGQTIDHLCRTKRCVNPGHLDPCPTGENSLRSPHTLAGANARKTHCPQGHPYSGENLFYDQGKRRCRVCVRAKNRRAHHRRRAERASATPQ